MPEQTNVGHSESVRFAVGAYVVVYAETAEAARARVRDLATAEDHPIRIDTDVHLFINADDVEDISEAPDPSGHKDPS